MAKYNFGGGLSGEANKVNFRKRVGFENGKAFTFSALSREYVNFLSAVKSVQVDGARKSKSDLTFSLVKKLFVYQDPKTKFWSATNKKK